MKLKFISDIRLQNYANFEEYKQNLYQCETYYILLSIFEVSLRNSINDYFNRKISTNWLEDGILHDDTKHKIAQAKKQILQRRERVSPDKIIAELPFGFWTSLFRKSYANLTRIKDIKNILPNIPNKKQTLINRAILDKRLNHIRKFRNRVFHYEPIINKMEYKDMKHDILELLTYFDEELCNFAKELTNNQKENVHE